MLMTPYLNAYYTVFLQVVQPLEIELMRGRRILQVLGLIVPATLIGALALLWVSHNHPSTLQLILPAERAQAIPGMAIPLAAAIAASGVLVGLGVADFLPTRQLQALMLLAVLILMLALVLCPLIPPAHQSLWVALIPVCALGIGTRVAYELKLGVG
jgi:hypothetical protein